MIDDCTKEASDTLIAACWQAHATLNAAEITAAASNLQGWLTLAAGVLAAVGATYGGWMAYRGAIRQSKLEESAHDARIAAYRFKLREIVASFELTSDLHLHTAEEQLETWKENAEPEAMPLSVQQYRVPKELRDDDWEEHAKLGLEVVSAMHEVIEALREAYRFGDEMLRGSTTGSRSRVPTVKKSTTNDDGSMTVEFDRCVEQNVKVARDLRDALRRLRQALAEAPASERNPLWSRASV